MQVEIDKNADKARRAETIAGIAIEGRYLGAYCYHPKVTIKQTKNNQWLVYCEKCGLQEILKQSK